MIHIRSILEILVEKFPYLGFSREDLPSNANEALRPDGRLPDRAVKHIINDLFPGHNHGILRTQIFQWVSERDQDTSNKTSGQISM